jgi:hypothetical protein
VGIAKDFNDMVHNQIRVHAAWLPVTNVFQVGDFGVISEGVFTRMGNIRSDFGVDFETMDGQPSQLDFKSASVRVIRFTAGAEVNVFPEDNLEAKLRIEFGKERSFYVKALMQVKEMASVFDAARKIAVLPSWNEDKFKVVAATYTGQNCVVLSSRQNNTAIEIGGKADALKRLELGGASADFSWTANSTLGLEVVGQTGVLGLRLFQVKKKKGEAEFLTRGRAITREDLEITELTQPGTQLSDDL